MGKKFKLDKPEYDDNTLLPKGYRALGLDEVIIEGDIFYGSDPPNDPPKLHKALSIGWTPRHSIHMYRYFRKEKK